MEIDPKALLLHKIDNIDVLESQMTAQLAHFISQSVLLKSEVRDLRMLLNPDPASDSNPGPTTGDPMVIANPTFSEDQLDIGKQLALLNHLISATKPLPQELAETEVPKLQRQPSVNKPIVREEPRETRRLEPRKEIAPEPNQASVAAAEMEEKPIEKRFKCNQCGFATTNVGALERHKQSHKSFVVRDRVVSADRPHQCPECGAGFSTIANVKRHISAAHAENRGRLVSLIEDITPAPRVDNAPTGGGGDDSADSGDYEEDGQEIGDIDVLDGDDDDFKADLDDPEAGAMTHAFKCTKCPATFNNEANLRRHGLSHSGAKPFACDRCDYRTNYRANLKAHSLTKHDNNISFRCKHPGCGFVTHQRFKYEEHVQEAHPHE